MKSNSRLEHSVAMRYLSASLRFSASVRTSSASMVATVSLDCVDWDGDVPLVVMKYLLR